jgi:hypothetical protein
MAYFRIATQGEIALGTAPDLSVSPLSLAQNVWFFSGNTVSALKNFGTKDDYEIPFIQNNVERMRLTSGGLSVGTTSASTGTTKLLIDSGTLGNSGIQFTQFFASSTTATGAPIGVDDTGKIVRISNSSLTSSFNVASNSGTPVVISSGDTLTITAGLGLSGITSATDTITLSLNANLDALTDVTMGTPSTGNFLIYSGSTWVNSTYTPMQTVSAVDTSEIDFTVTGTTAYSFSAVLATTTVVAGSYGSAASGTTFTVDSKGRLTAAGTVAIAFPINQLTDVDTVSSAPSNGQFLSWNGTNWIPATVSVPVSGATNGLQVISGSVGLGGTLTTGTTVTLGANNLNFDINSTGKIGVDTTTPTSGFDVNTSVSCGAIRSTTVSTALTDTDYMLLVNCTSGSTITLPAVSGVTRREYVIKKIGGGNVTIDPNSAELIDGATSYTISSSYVSIKLKCDGAAWYIF